MEISKRLYLIAHAPEKPQKWFRPSMPSRPVPSDLNQLDRSTPLYQEIYQWIYSDEDPLTEEGVAWVDATHDAAEAMAAWQLEYKKQRLIQWPLAWADEILNSSKQQGHSL